MAGLSFGISENRIKKSILNNMEFVDGSFIANSTGKEDEHIAYIYTIDSGVEDCGWGRLTFDMEKEESGSVVIIAFASNNRYYEQIVMGEDSGSKLVLAEQLEAVKAINNNDVLLYDIEGRYLWIYVGYYGEKAKISNIKITSPGDTFMNAFPEVYREKNSFFHRFISIFSSVYSDFQDEIDNRAELLDIDKAPIELLTIYGKWLGIDLSGGYLDEKIMRAFMKEAGELLRKKGTVECVSRICEIIVGQKPQVVERALLAKKSASASENYDKLYGTTDYDVSLVFTKEIDENQRGVLQYILVQFIPARIRFRIVSLENSGVLDSYIYLDENAYTFENKTGGLDSMIMADGSIILE